MKRILFLFSIAALIGCSKNQAPGIVYDTAASVPPAAQQIAPQTPPATMAPKVIAKHGDTTITADGLKWIDTKIGTGQSPESGQTITVNYTGMLTNGKKFDSNVDPSFHHVEPFTTQIGTGHVIQGWDEGMLTMKVGGKRRLIVPAALGYGAEGMGDKIPGGATLIFDVELLNVK